MNNKLSKVTLPNQAFANKNVNHVLLGFDTSRENVALSKYTNMKTQNLFYYIYFFSVGYSLIDPRLKVPEFYCQELTHESCEHAIIEYDEEFHVKNELLTLEFIKKGQIPCPETSYAIWKILNDYLENRKTEEKNTFYVRWGQQCFNVEEVNTLKNFALECILMKSDIEKEKEFLRSVTNQMVPPGIICLDQQDADISSMTQMVLADKMYLKNDLPLTNVDRTKVHYEDFDHSQVYNFSHPDRQFNEDDLHAVMVILNNQEGGSDKFLVFTPELRDESVCTNYVERIGGKTAKRIHVVLNLSVRNNRINLTRKDGHWTYCSMDEEMILFGDPLGSHWVPTNLVKTLNPIYRAMYGKDIGTNVQIRNCSNNVNFPLQTCSTICGLIAAMLCICSFSEDLYNEILFSKKENLGLNFIKNPSYFKEQIRMRFLKVISSKKHMLQQ